MIRKQFVERVLSLALLLVLGLPPALHADWDGASWADYSAFMSPITPEVKARLRAILADGVTQGRVPGRMCQFGDSITNSYAYFRNAVVVGLDQNQTGHDYGPVMSWLAYNGTKPADSECFYADKGKDGDWGNYSGWHLSTAMRYGHPRLAIVDGNGAVPGDFSWTLIMFGTNDVDDWNYKVANFKDSMRSFVQGCIDLGVIPVLSTIPPEAAHEEDGLTYATSQAIRELAVEMQIPYVDYEALVLHYHPSNWQGTLISDDGTHPSAGGGGVLFSQEGLTTTDGYAARTKLTLDMAEKIQHIIFENGPPELITPTEGETTGRLKAGYR
jgi:hypothetical protein